MNHAPYTYIKPHTVLPLDAQAMLMRAAATPTPDHDPMARTRAVSEATRRVKRMYPACFQAEPVLEELQAPTFLTLK